MTRRHRVPGGLPPEHRNRRGEGFCRSAQGGSGLDKLRVLLVDDHRLMRDGLRAILSAEADMEVCGEANRGREGVEKARQLRPDVVLMDIRLPDVDGIEATRQVLALLPRVAVLVLSAFDQEEYLLAALRAGASGYLLKDAPSHEVIGAIRCAARGDAWLHPSMARKLVDATVRRRPAAAGPAPALTDRERQVLSLIAQGATNREIASRLFLTEKTVKQHASKIFRKLQVRTRSQAALYAVQHGLAG